MDKFELNTLGLKAEQVKLVALKLHILSQLVLAREAFHKKLSAFMKDTAWEPVLKEKKKTGSATTPRTNSRQKAMSYYRIDGTEGTSEKGIQGLLTNTAVFVLSTLFSELKQILPHNENLKIETLRLIVASNTGVVRPYTI